MEIKLRIHRFDKLHDPQNWIDTHTLTMDPADRVLDALLEVSRRLDPSFTFRKSCAHGVCGSDAMRINGREALACKILIRDAVSSEVNSEQQVIEIEPLRHLPIVRDLIVDQEPFFEKYRSVHPFLKPHSVAPEHEYHQTPEERALFDDPTKCINCSACYSACPVLEKNPNFLGPAALVQASRFVFDNRDVGLEERVNILDQVDGVWACENHFECTRVCPREIKVTKMINLMKQKIKKYRGERGEATSEPVKAE